MPSNFREVAAALRRLRGGPRETFTRRFREFGFKILEGAINNTPVNTGRLRGGWHVTIDTPSGVDVSTEAGSSKTALSEGDGSGGVNKAEAGDTIWIQNNVPYAPVIEHGLFVPKDPGPSKATHVPKSRRKTVEGVVLVKGGFHVSAPNGMLADAIQQAVAAVLSD
jgi:hypothetical protein